MGEKATKEQMLMLYCELKHTINEIIEKYPNHDFRLRITHNEPMSYDVDLWLGESSVTVKGPSFYNAEVIANEANNCTD